MDVQAILDEIRKCSSTLIQDQYGNYVIQHVMKVRAWCGARCVLII